MTDAEVRLWFALREQQVEGHRFRRQVPLGSYVADFACLKAGLIIEVDGGQHVTATEQDAARTAWLEAHGFRVIRFWDGDVLRELDGVLETIRKELVTPHPNPPPQGGRECPPTRS